MKKTSTILSLLLLFMFSASAQEIFLKGILQGSQQVPANASAATGVLLVRYNLTTKVFELGGDYQNLSAFVTMSHVHNAAAGANGPVIFDLTNTSLFSGRLSATVTLTEAQEVELLAGRMYANVHTLNYPNGEVRAQLTQATVGMSYTFGTVLNGVEEVPSNGSAGSGPVAVLLDKGTDSIYVTGGFTGLGSASSNAHIHLAAAGVSGPVVFPLTFTQGFTSGVLSTSGPITEAQQADLEAGLMYVNIHSVNFPAGEIRGQIIAGGPLPVKLTYFTGFRNDQEVMLEWSVASQENFKNFTVEQLNATSNQWVAKGTVPAGTVNNKAFSFTDKPLLSSGVVLYRLRMTDLNGSISYSPIVKINFANGIKPTLTLLANPILGNEVRFQLNGFDRIISGNAVVIDMGGRVIARLPAITQGANTLKTANLAKGIYRLMVYSNGQKFEASFMK